MKGAAVQLLERLTWWKHASFVYAGSVRIAFDPWQGTAREPADIVLVTHEHYDHCDPEAVARLTKDGTVIVAAAGAAAKLRGDVRAVNAGDVVQASGVTVTATEAYNVNKKFHPRGLGVGYLVAVDGGTIFHAGDTDDIPETHGLKPDAALLPVGGTYTMDVPEGVAASRAIGATVSIPMHYGYIVGSSKDGERFAATLGPAARVLTPVEPFTR